MSVKINYIEIPVRDLEAAKVFYKQVFGWKFTDFGQSYSAFKRSGIQGGLYQSENAMRVDKGSALVVLYYKNLEKIQDKVIKNGGAILIETFSFPGGKRFHFTDVCGNELAVWSDKE